MIFVFYPVFTSQSMEKLLENTKISIILDVFLCYEK